MDAANLSVRVTAQRMERALKAPAGMRGAGAVERQALESVIGQIVSMRPAVGPVQLSTRELYRGKGSG